MKRYTLLAVCTTLAIGFILLSGQFVKNSIVRVSAIRLVPGTAEETVLCTGRVESPDDSKVYATSGGLAQKVYVKEGDRVTRGQSLVDVAVSSEYSQGLSSGYQMNSSYLSQPQTSSSSSPVAISTLTSPVDGIVTSVGVTDGMYVSATEPAVVVKSTSGVQVRLSVEESQISELKVGQPAQITGVGFQNSIYSGVLASISDEARQLTTTSGQETVIDAVVTVKNPGSDIKPGFTAKAKITTSKSSSILIVPYEAVREDDSGAEYVFRFLAGRAVKTPVQTGKEFNSGFEIRQGLKADDIIIMNPDSVANGTRVVPTISRAVISVG